MAAECEVGTDVYSPRAESLSNHRAYRMVVVGGPETGSKRLIDSHTFRIGKASSNHLRISDATVSRFHCVVEHTPRGLMLRDLGSLNGTRVGGCWVERAYLVPGVPIRIGSTTLEIVPDETGIAPALPTPVYDAKILGSSPAIQRVLSSLPKIAGSSVTILLEGETGTGKSLLAELIHEIGRRSNGPFMVVDCASIPPTLIQSELFGHERGAFTGANERRIGAFEAANGGTLFLDEIGELPLDMQPNLLRALEQQTIKRIGSVKSIRIDVQIIAATNRDLREAMARGDFRSDLYYRLDTLRLQLPPLRDRREDIPDLVEHFAQRVHGDVHPTLIDEMKRTFAERGDWPGNIRELRNAVEKTILLGGLSGGDIPSRELESFNSLEFDSSLSFRTAKDQAIAAWERGYLASLLAHTENNVSKAARLAQMDRSHLRDLLRRHQIGER